MSSYASTVEHWRTRRLRIIVSRACTGNLVQTLDYYPYGATRVSVGTSTNEKRKYIDQFSDDSGLSYLNARFYDTARGQFISQDSVFLGDPKEQDLNNPQSLNSYSYANDNPVTGKDPTGKQVAMAAPVIGGASVSGPLGWILLALSAIIVALNVISLSGGQGVHAAPSVTSSPTPLVQSISMPVMLNPLANTGASAGRQSGVSVTPLTSMPWANVNLSQRITLPSPDQLSGKTPQEINQILQDKGLTGRPSCDGDGVRYDVPGQPGDQVRLMPGNPGDSNPAKQVPYGRVTQNGKTSDPFPISGKPNPNP